MSEMCLDNCSVDSVEKNSRVYLFICKETRRL